jgi:MFS family permease
MNCGLYAVALCLYAYGVHEVPPQNRADLQAVAAAQRPTGSAVSRYLRIALNPKVLLFAPTWLAINAILGLWATQATLLLKGNISDPSQFLMKGVPASTIGDGTAVLAAVFGAGILFWGLVYARFRRTTLLLIGVGAFVAMTLDILAINHFGGISTALLLALGAVAVVALFVLAGATPAALGLLADVSEGFEDDRSAIMGLYSVFLGLGQVIGAVVGGLAATWKGIDGLIVATTGLLLIAIVALANLRKHEGADAGVSAGGGMPATMRDTIRDTLLVVDGGRPRGPQAAGEEKR